MKDKNPDELDAVMTSLHYLESEASKAGMKEVSGILKRTISDIEWWINTGSRCGSNLYESTKINGILIRATSDIERIKSSSRRGSNLQDLIMGYYAIYWDCFMDCLELAGAVA